MGVRWKHVISDALLVPGDIGVGFQMENHHLENGKKMSHHKFQIIARLLYHSRRPQILQISQTFSGSCAA